METQTEDKVSSQPIQIDKVLEKINEIAKVSATGDYIYRGESECYEKVSSSLYRQYHIEAEHFDVAVVQPDILTAAQDYTHRPLTDFERLATLQHYGDNTNLIDFTTDYLVALFFACDGEPGEPGRVILLRRQSKSDSEGYTVEKPLRTIPHAEAQKRIFVRAEKGFVEPDRIVTIPAHLKCALLDHLRKHHDISTKTIYKDLLGFIENWGFHENVYTEFYEGLTCQGRAGSARTLLERERGYKDAIEHYTEAIHVNLEDVCAYNERGLAYVKQIDFGAAISDFNTAIALAPEDARGYCNRGLAYLSKCDFDMAIADYTTAIALDPENPCAYNERGLAYAKQSDFATAISDYTTAIALDPEDAGPYCYRGEAWLHLKEWQKAKANLITAKYMGYDIVASFHIDYKSVEAFEVRNEVKLPEDIAALLQRK